VVVYNILFFLCMGLFILNNSMIIVLGEIICEPKGLSQNDYLLSVINKLIYSFIRKSVPDDISKKETTTCLQNRGHYVLSYYTYKNYSKIL